MYGATVHLTDMYGLFGGVLTAGGLTVVFALALRIVSDALIQRRALRALAPRRNRVTSLGALLAGFLTCVATLSRPATLLWILAGVDGGDTRAEATVSSTAGERDGESTSRPVPGEVASGSAFLSVAGANAGLLVPLWLISAAIVAPAVMELALLLLAFSLPFRVGLKARRSSRIDILLGIGIALLSVGLLRGALPAHSAGTAAAWPPAVIVPLAAAATAWAIGSSMSVALTVLVVFLAGWISAPFAVVSLLSANLGGLLAGVPHVRRLGRTARRIELANLLLNGAVLGAGGALLFVAAGGVLLTNGGLPGVLAYYSVLTILGVLGAVVIRARVARWSARVAGGHDAGTPDPAEPSGEVEPLRLLPFDLPNAVESNLVLMEKRLARMARWTSEMLTAALNAGQLPERIVDSQERCTAVQRSLELSRRQIIEAFLASARVICTAAQALRLQKKQRIAVELSEIGREIQKFLNVLHRSHRKRYRFHKKSAAELFDITAQVLDLLNYNADFLNGTVREQQMNVAISMEDAIDKARDKIRKRARKTIERKKHADVRGEFAFVQAVSYLERIGDRCLIISATIASGGL